jgi:Ca-activated chloride channel family protein
MNFAWPQLLWLLALPLALLARELASRAGRASSAHPKILRAEAGLHDVALATARPTLPGRRRLWLVGGVALAVVALARPQWGRVEEPLFNQSREIVLAVDLSRSMLTPDVTPSRLERAKLLIQSLLDRLAGERVGLVVFSGTAFLQSPLSADYEILREFLPAMGPDFLPVGGTNYGPMIDAAADAFQGTAAADRFLIVLSDGGANDEDWRDHIGKLKDKGIRVIGLGVGTAAGGFIPDAGGGFMKDEKGAVVLAKLESDTLKELANRTGGAYRDAGGWVDLSSLLKATVEAGRKGGFVEKTSVRYVERFQWVLAPALLCLLVSFWREFPVRPKPRQVALSKSGGKAPKNGIQAATAALGILGFALLAPSLGWAAEKIAQPESDAPNPSQLLGRIVGRLSSQDAPSALDWAELGHQTVTWGQELQSGHQPVAAGPVNDALAAADAGSALDPKATDWPRLRSDLHALLAKPPDRKQDKQQQNQQKNQQQSSQQSKPQQSPRQEKQKQPQKQEGSEGQPKTQRQQEPPGGTQKVGGARARKGQDPAAADPSLAIPVEKLNQVREQDAPAELYQMIQNKEPRPAPADNGKNW